ncbi:sulfatase [Pandoraea terrae]|uniref:Sulfatase n=1 Tax=Pandoraea terrae TaxID=1537710 RepID=A0A5E4SFA1_9BURK|nr:SUMF1/EgtB/PvdO family nonheme iron enzyme [Pandoraea terrae]VVD74566.1 sulfatase [Pandoraea terrae]
MPSGQSGRCGRALRGKRLRTLDEVVPLLEDLRRKFMRSAREFFELLKERMNEFLIQRIDAALATGVPFDLSTEAQWEYAARSGGQNFIWATDNGHLDIGRNAPSYEQEKLLSPVVKGHPTGQGAVWRTALNPVGMFPPNPLGFYDMSSNGWEWMQDRYDASYYQVSPERDPKGPASGTKRVERGYAEGDYPSGGVLNRFSRDPMITGRNLDTWEMGPGLPATHTVRCAVNLARPVAGVK